MSWCSGAKIKVYLKQRSFFLESGEQIKPLSVFCLFFAVYVFTGENNSIFPGDQMDILVPMATI